jgi:hypothetical protein
MYYFDLYKTRNHTIHEFMFYMQYNAQIHVVYEFVYYMKSSSNLFLIELFIDSTGKVVMVSKDMEMIFCT